MKVSLVFTFVALVPALAAVPRGVTKNPVPGHTDITLYAWPSAQTLPSFWEAFFKLFRLPNDTKAELPFQRSIAVLVGIGNYRFITPKLQYVSRDVEKMRDYLLGDGGFDGVYVVDEDVSPEVLSTFMSDELPKYVGPKDRLLFYYSGHGADPGTGRPLLQFQQARPGQWGQNTLRVDEYEQWSFLLKAEHVLFIYDACMAGEATMAKGGKEETRTAVTELSGNGSRIVVTAGTASQAAWVVKESSAKQYSIFTEALLCVLRDGTAESRQVGFMTIGQAVADAAVLLADMTRHLGPGHEMNPDPVNIGRARTGTFVFLNPHAYRPILPDGDIRAMGITVPKGAAGADFEKERELALWNGIKDLDDPQLYARFCDEYPNGLFCAAARKRVQRLTAVSKLATAPDLTILTVAELKALADNGSRDALTQLGRVYESGLQGAQMDLQSSIGFYKRASGLGDANAAFRIGSIYFSGRNGVPKDDAQAEAWYRHAAEAGDGRGMTFLGIMYRRGLGGLPRNDAQAVTWYRKAAEAGDGFGMSRLGFMYEEGLGIPKDEAKAVSWFRNAAEAGNGLGMANLGFMYERGLGGLTRDDAQAVTWYQKAAEAGDGLGMANLGAMYRSGLGGLPKDIGQALNWFRKAAIAGDGSGMTDLGIMYQNGLGGLAKDDAQAANWFRKAAECDDAPGMDNLGFMYLNGLGGLPRDVGQAVNLFRKAADLGDSLGMFNLGAIYERGLGGFPKDIVTALTWYRKAAELGDDHAQAALARLGRS